MSKNKLTLKIERFNSEAPNGEYQKIEIYADGKDISSTLIELYKIAIETVNTTSRNKKLNIEDIVNTQEQ